MRALREKDDRMQGAVPALAVNGILFLFVMLFTRSFNAMQKFMTQKMGLFFILFCYVVPLLAWFLRKEKKK